MRALVCHRLGDPTQSPAPGGVLSVETGYKSPHLPKDGVRIRVAAGSVNFADTLLVQGKYQEKLPLPFIPGSEVRVCLSLHVGYDFMLCRYLIP
jgi:NADPH2:quinone reductase